MICTKGISGQKEADEIQYTMDGIRKDYLALPMFVNLCGPHCLAARFNYILQLILTLYIQIAIQTNNGKNTFNETSVKDLHKRNPYEKLE